MLAAGRGSLARFVALGLIALALGASPACVTRGAPPPTALGAAAAQITPPAQPSRPVVDFPSAQSLADIEGQPAEVPAVTAGEIPADGWKVEPTPGAPDAAPDDAWQPHGAWEQAFADDVGAARGGLRLTRTMSCVAREVGLFYLRTRARPPGLLQQFLTAACGAFVPQVGYSMYGGGIPAAASDDQVLARWRPAIKSDLMAPLPAAATEAGFWYGRSRGRDRAIAIVCYASPRARVTALALVPDAQGNVTLDGELLEAADFVEGFVNQGRFGVQRCALDAGVTRPRFRAVCHVADGDTAAWVQLLAAPPRRALVSPFL
jgi:hypothetical protein